MTTTAYGPAGFPAGTLVHTQEGLLPIEQIKVGDFVLSQPEQKGERAYKQVVKTFVHHDKEIRRLDYRIDGEPDRSYPIYSTHDHPFWAVGQGWTAAAKLYGGWMGPSRFELIDGSTNASLYQGRDVYRTDKPGVGWFGSPNTGGAEWDFVNSRLVATKVEQDTDIEESADPYFKTTVYNVEVEDFHTYYVGKHGIWVHKANC